MRRALKKIKVRFESDPSLKEIEVLIRASTPDEQTASLMEQIDGGRRKVLTVTVGDGTILSIPVEDVLSVSVAGKQVQIVTANACYFVRRSLQSFESELDDREFVRISRYELVNLNKVKKYDFTLGGMLRLELEGGMVTWASRRCIPAIRRRLTGKE